MGSKSEKKLKSTHKSAGKESGKQENGIKIREKAEKYPQFSRKRVQKAEKWD